MPSTPPEEIARQHADAVLMVQAGTVCTSATFHDEIPLTDMECPTCERYSKYAPSSSAAANIGDASTVEEKKDHMDIDVEGSSLTVPQCFSTRGHVDVSNLERMIREGYNDIFPTESPEDGTSSAADQKPFSKTNYWDPRNAATNNVAVTRPSHDAWGIKKIALLFCDDFTHRIYQLPWWKDFEASLQPILDLFPENHCLVRALFACLPPGVTIPIHHDTGEWVKATHRVHIPILVTDPSKVLFRVGPTLDQMQRIECTPGHVFEINNQAKHAVSNCGDDCRVHLILDYTTTAKKERILLEPGERLVQTRRSIDRWKDVRDHQRPAPSFMILGAQKAGTTSLYEYMVQHPWVIRARRRETHCLDWRWNDALKKKESQLEYCRKFFFAEELKNYPSCMTGDSTPSYLLDSRRVIPRVKQLFDWNMRFFVMLRDPVKRAESHYAMVTSRDGTEAQLKTRGKEWRDKTLEQVVRMELKKMDECGLIPYFDIESGIVNIAGFESFCGSAEENKAWDQYLQKHVPLNTGSYGLLTRGMYALQLRPWLRAFDRDQFLVIQLERMNHEGVQRTMEQVWAHLDLPNFPVEDESVKNSRSYEPMDEDLKAYLQRFFQPHNQLLSKVLNSEEWAGVWEYQ